MRNLTGMKPFRMIGNLYFVGTKEASSHLIATEEGLILIDTGYSECADIVIRSIEELGFSVKDIKYILHSHGHGDRTHATGEILKSCPGAKTLLSFKDLRYIKGFTPDIDITDGYTLKLGETEILCLYTPGHTEGSCSFFFNVTEEGVSYRAGMFGGAGTNQLKKKYMNERQVSYLMRGEFLRSIDRLLGERVDVMVGNHTWHNRTPEKYELLGKTEINPFVDPTEWEIFLNKQKLTLWDIIHTESKSEFITYAHRGASQYCPENTLLSFYTGVYMGANGIETDVHRTKDGVLVLFHDSTLERVCGVEGRISDYTYEELCKIPVKRGELYDRIPTLEDFLTHFSGFDLTFAIELKGHGVEEDVADMIFKYGYEKKTVVTSFHLDYIKKIKAYSPTLKIGHLTKDVSDEATAELLAIGCDEICPEAKDITPERVEKWHSLGFNVRAWGVYNEGLMKAAYDAGADGMTVNFPDKLVAYIKEKNSADA